LNNRYYALDVFRGATVALMIMVNNPGSWSYMFPPLKHASWHGCTPTDLVFPFFLFAVGNAMAFVMPRFQAGPPAQFWKKVIKRTVLIFAIGFLLNWAPFVKWKGDELMGVNPLDVRIFGVLQRIALCYFFASILVFYAGPKKSFVAGGILLLLYWYGCWYFGDATDPYSLEGFWGTQVDRLLIGETNIYKGEGVPFEPEGIISTLPAIVQVVFGYLTGNLISSSSNTDKFRVISTVMISGFGFYLAGLAWDLNFPINKKMWTSSYVLYTSGLAMMCLGVLMYLLDVKQYRGWFSRFFDVFGKNPLFIFVLSGLLPRVIRLFRIPNGQDAVTGEPLYTNALTWFYKEVCAPISERPETGSLVYSLAMITFYWLIVWWMDRRRIYVKV